MSPFISISCFIYYDLPEKLMFLGNMSGPRGITPYHLTHSEISRYQKVNDLVLKEADIINCLHETWNM